MLTPWQISALHSTISTTSFVASTGFHLTEAFMNSISGLSIQGLATLNAILGSTESSRAVAAIITLIRDELNKPEVGGTGEVVTYLDLIIGTVGFVMLQRWGRRKTELDFRDSGGEEAIWDAVIDDKGFRADVVGTRRKGMISLNANATGPAMTFASPDGEDEFEALERGTLYDPPAVALSTEDQTKLSDEEIRERIMSQLPTGARAVITSETITAKTIKVDIYDAQTAHIDAPPGTVMVAERLNHDRAVNGSQGGPHQTVIFRTALKRSSSNELRSSLDQLRLTGNDGSPPDHADADDILMMKTASKRISIVDEPIQIEPASFSGSDREEDAIESSSPPTSSPPKLSGPVANQKKSRRPIMLSSKSSPGMSGTSRIPLIKSKKDKSPPASKSDKSGVIKKALKTLSPSQSSAAVKDIQRAPSQHRKPLPALPVQASRSRAPSTTRGDITPHRNYAGMGRAHTPLPSPSVLRAAESSTSYFTLQHTRRDSIVSQTTETYSVHSHDSRPSSPTFTRMRTRVVNGMTPTKSELGLALDETESRLDPSTGTIHHRRSRSFVPSFYSMATRDSKEAILLAPKTPVPRKSIYEDHSILAALINDGKVPGIFPDRHLVKTVRRFARFASASYGSNFMRVMGITTASDDDLSKSTELMTLNVHHEHSSFSSHTGLPPDTILLSSFYDPKGVTGNTDWSPSAISPLIHFISIDDDSKAVVLTCRGTLGFEDVLTDMTCDYDDLVWQGQPYKVHKGIHASARRLLGGSGSRIMATIRATLEQYPDYGLVLCGHSLGGAVAAVLAILIAEPSYDDSKTSFVTGNKPKLLTHHSDGPFTTYVPPIALPAGRPIHVYAYGTPACVSELLRSATRGLITTIVNHADIVPCLSLGILHDFRTVALHLKHDTTDALGALKTRVWNRVANAVKSAFYNNPKGPPPPENMAGDGLGEDTWAWSALKTLRAAMVNDKLVPPGEIFVVETTRVFDRLDPDVAREAVFGPEDSRDDRTEKLYRALGRPATRVRFLWVRDVERRFGELRFGRDMFGDHSPGRYETALAALERGICED